MTFVVTEQCIRCKFMSCIKPCPVDCFYEGPDFLVINPDECIDCSVCVTECPVNAIYQDKDLPAEQREFIGINRRFSQIWPPADAASAPLAEREQWRGVPMKRQFLPADVLAQPDFRRERNSDVSASIDAAQDRPQSSENGVRT